MKKPITIIITILLLSTKCYSQKLPGFTEAESRVIRALVQKSVDSVRAEYKAADAALIRLMDVKDNNVRIYADTNSTRKINNLPTLQFNQLDFKQDSARGGYFISIKPKLP